MPIHLIWGDDNGSSDHAINLLINEIINPSWISLNLSRLDGQDSSQANQALEEAQTPPFGEGGRVVILKRSPFCNGCSVELSGKLEAIVKQIPHNTHLILNNSNKPDKRLKTTKLLQSLIPSNKVLEQKFLLPPIWDGSGQKDLIRKIANDLNFEIEEDAILSIIESVGNDSSRIISEIRKIALLEEAQASKDNNKARITITSKSAKALVSGYATNSLEIGDCLINRKFIEAISKIDFLLDQGEPALKIIATLTGQVRGLLWVGLLEEQQQHDINFIAKQAGISNPKRIYIMRKQLKGKSTDYLIDLLSRILKVEAMVKKGELPKNAFRDSLFAKH